jgi:peptide/nickel transport system substrate-binding protein
MGRIAEGHVTLYLGALTSNSGADASEIFDSALHTPEVSAGYGDANQNGYSNPELDRLIEATRSAPDLPDRQALLQRCARLALQDLPLIPLYVADDIYGVRPGVDLQLRLDGRVFARNVRRSATTRQ